MCECVCVCEFKLRVCIIIGTPSLASFVEPEVTAW